MRSSGRPVTRGDAGEAKPLENFSPPWKNVLGIVQNCWMGIVEKVGPLSQNSSPPLVSQAGYGPRGENFSRFCSTIERHHLMTGLNHTIL